MNEQLYLENGYLNFNYIWKAKCPFNWIFGARGTGKTYSGSKFFINDLHKKFLYIRRTQKQLDLSTTPDLMPFKKINKDMNTNIQPITQKDFVWFKDGNKEIAFGASLSTFYNLRGVSLDDYEILMFDEVIPEIMERTRRGEGRACSDMIETINRNRELQGRKPLRCFFFGNSDTLDSDILRSFGIIGIVEKMVERGQEVYINKNTGNAVFNLFNSPISQKKKNTALYKAVKNKAFIDKAINNVFVDLRDSTDIKRVPLSECRIFCNIDGEVGIYEHKTSDFFYCCKVTNAGAKNYVMNTLADRRSFARIYGQILRNAIDTENILYDSFETKSAVQNYLYNY